MKGILRDHTWKDEGGQDMVREARDEELFEATKQGREYAREYT
jgi:hypothetical protein